MNYVIKALQIFLFWLGLINSLPEVRYFGLTIYNNDIGIPARTCPNHNCAVLGLIYTGTFEIVTFDIFDNQGNEWIEVALFDNWRGWVKVDYRAMTTTFSQPPGKIIMGSGKNFRFGGE